jgi:hypothetical protein
LDAARHRSNGIAELYLAGFAVVEPGRRIVREELTRKDSNL